MALYKQIEFAKLCGVSTGNLSTYIKRKKVMLTKAGMVDDSVSQNSEFKDKWQEKNAAKLQKDSALAGKASAKKTERHIAGPGEIPFENVIEPEKRVRKNQVDQHVSDLNVLEKRQKAQQLVKTQVETELLQQKIKKLEGETIPTALVTAAFGQHFKSFTASIKNFNGKLLMELTKRKEFSRAEIAEIKGKMLQHLNTAIQDAVGESKKSIGSILSDYSNRKDVGERE